MQLKHKGPGVQVTLTKTEMRQLEKTQELLGTIAMLPCGQKERSNEAAMILGELARELAAKPAEDQGILL